CAFVNALFVAPWRLQRARQRITRAPGKISQWLSRRFAPFALGFVLIYPVLILAINGPSGALKWIDNFGIQILIYVMLGFGLNIVVGLAGLLDLGYVAFYAV